MKEVLQEVKAEKKSDERLETLDFFNCFGS